MAAFSFGFIVNFLESLEQIEVREVPLPRVEKKKEQRKTIDKWFECHRDHLDRTDTDLGTIISTIFPHRRPDRVYRIQQNSLAKTIPRCLHWGTANVKCFERFKLAGNGDLASCLAKVVELTDEAPRMGRLTVVEVDEALTEIASHVRFSSPKLKALAPENKRQHHEILGPVLRKARSVEAKWLARIILKDLSPVVLEENYVLRKFHFLLPGLLRFQDDVLEASKFLDGPLKNITARPSPSEIRALTIEAERKIRPTVGIKIGRPFFHKARSIKHCLQLASSNSWVVERKYDGEYCEVHIDLSKDPKEVLQIYSKSGKDSTADRSRLHESISKSLRIGQGSCGIQHRCIILGEMVVYDTRKQQIAEFHKIRKHASRSGVYLGTDADSQRHPWEQLMIVWFDLLLLDDEMVFSQPLLERRKKLSGLVSKIAGRSKTAERVCIDFTKPEAEEWLLNQFSAARYHRHEGLVLKPAQAAYVSLGGPYSGPGRVLNSFIKLKADYMQELKGERDVADFAVIGARYDAQQAQKSSMTGLLWTTFYLGCLVNKLAVLQWAHRPEYRAVGAIHVEKCIPPQVLSALHEQGKFQARPYIHGGNLPEYEVVFHKQSLLLPMEAYFPDPLVVEVLGSAFDKAANEDIYMLRHPRILKLHLDRTWRDCVSVEELQILAEDAKEIPGLSQSEIDETSQKINQYMARFKEKATQQSAPTPRSTPRASAASTLTPLSTTKSSTKSRSPPVLVRIDTSERKNQDECYASPLQPGTGKARKTLEKGTPPLDLNLVQTSDPRPMRESSKDNIRRSIYHPNEPLPTPPSSKETLKQTQHRAHRQIKADAVQSAAIDMAPIKQSKSWPVIPGSKKRSHNAEGAQTGHDDLRVRHWLEALDGAMSGEQLAKRKRLEIENLPGDDDHANENEIEKSAPFPSTENSTLQRVAAAGIGSGRIQLYRTLSDQVKQVSKTLDCIIDCEERRANDQL